MGLWSRKKMVHLILVVTSEVLHPGCGEVDPRYPSHLYFLVGKTTEPWVSAGQDVDFWGRKTKLWMWGNPVLQLRILTNTSPNSYGGFLNRWYPTTMVFPTTTDHFRVFWGYHHLRKHPYIHWAFHIIAKFWAFQLLPNQCRFLRLLSGRNPSPRILMVNGGKIYQSHGSLLVRQQNLMARVQGTTPPRHHVTYPLREIAGLIIRAY